MRGLARFGVVPNKSLTATVPGFVALNPHWWRGCIDGDGWVIFTRADRPVLGFCGTEQSVVSFSTFAASVVSHKCSPAPQPHSRGNWKVTISGHKAVAVLRVLYGTCAFALPRKLAAAKRAFDLYPSDRPKRRNLKLS